MSTIEGTVDGGFEGVRDAFAEAQAGDPGNAQLCLYHHGKVVVDLWTTRDTQTERPYGPDSISITMSCSKAMTATCVHLLAQRGLLDLDAPVAQYWPEFAAGGKNAITVSEVLSHRAGLMTFDPPLSTADLLDWERAVEALAAMRPLWEPGSAYAYHSLTFGFLAGELVRRVSGRSVGRFLADEVVAPLEVRPTSRFSVQDAVGRTSVTDWPRSADATLHGHERFRPRS